MILTRTSTDYDLHCDEGKKWSYHKTMAVIQDEYSGYMNNHETLISFTVNDDNDDKKIMELKGKLFYCQVERVL